MWFEEASSEFQVSCKEVSRVFQGSSNGFKVIWNKSKEIPEKFQRCFKCVSRKFKGCCKKVLRTIEGCFNRVLNGFQWCLKDIQWVVEESFKGISRILKAVLRVFQGRLRGVPRDLQGRFKWGSRVSKRSSKNFLLECLWQFLGCLKIVSSVFLKKFKQSFKSFQECFNGDLFLHFCCCMDLIAATRAEGGLVSIQANIKSHPIQCVIIKASALYDRLCSL